MEKTLVSFLCQSHKVYEYAHAGLFVMCTASLEPVIKTLKEHCTTFEDHRDMVSKLAYFRDNLDELYDLIRAQ